jgi:hypothetical protein
VVTPRAIQLKDNMKSSEKEMRKGAVTRRAEREIHKDFLADTLGYAAVENTMTEYV